MNDQIVELESKVAFLERLLDELNEVVTSQQSQIDRLQGALLRLQDGLTDMQDANSSPRRPEDERPPHY